MRDILDLATGDVVSFSLIAQIENLQLYSDNEIATYGYFCAHKNQEYIINLYRSNTLDKNEYGYLVFGI